VRARASLVATVAFAFFAGLAYAGGPGDVYNDFVQDGKLSCNHSRSDLLAVVRSGSINQYGDPLTLARLKLAIRRQLAGGCRASSASSRAGTGSSGTATAGRRGPTGGSGATRGMASGSRQGNPARSGGGTSNRRGTDGGARNGSGVSSPRSASSPSVSSGGNGSFVSNRALVAALLVAGLAIGGWLTRRGLAARH
jgi:cobalamin biosynthesis Mg chelatase CobN